MDAGTILIFGAVLPRSWQPEPLRGALHQPWPERAGLDGGFVRDRSGGHGLAAGVVVAASRRGAAARPPDAAAVCATPGRDLRPARKGCGCRVQACCCWPAWPPWTCCMRRIMSATRSASAPLVLWWQRSAWLRPGRYAAIAGERGAAWFFMTILYAFSGYNLLRAVLSGTGLCASLAYRRAGSRS